MCIVLYMRAAYSSFIRMFSFVQSFLYVQLYNEFIVFALRLSSQNVCDLLHLFTAVSEIANKIGFHQKTNFFTYIWKSNENVKHARCDTKYEYNGYFVPIFSILNIPIFRLNQ